MNIRFISSIVISLIVGFVGGYFFVNANAQGNSQNTNCEIQYKYINSRIGCLSSKRGIKKHEYTELVTDLTKYIESEKTAKRANHVSIYFRDLNNGPTFGIESLVTFVPASLLKVPVLITYLNLAEQDPALLSKKLSFTNDDLKILEQTTDASIPKLQEKKPYTVEELLSRMIKYSDNIAYEVLSTYLDISYASEMPFRQSMIALGMIDPRGPTESTITVKAYASIFRQLYNTSYLSADMSEKALQMLSETSYEKGLAAGIPKDIKIANKFGERTDTVKNEKQLHDCGIVYYPDNPYLICVMTTGDDINELTAVIKTVSEKVYKEVDSRKY